MKKLIRMQRFDDRIGDLDAQKEKLPRELDSLKTNLIEAESKVEQTKSALEDNQKQQKLKELDIQGNKEKMAKYENQLLAIKTNKEYKALNSEINHLKEKNSAIDDDILMLMEAETQLRTQLEEDNAAQDAAQKELDENEDRLRNRIGEVEKEIGEQRELRNELAGHLPRSLVKRYVLLIKNKQRKAVVFMENDACNGCGFRVRPQLAIEINRGTKIISCENCGRIIVEKPDDASA
ncbi:MAG: hypothetical protein K8R90_11415 [Candidatus Cloacimonetes bacterium]|nr:hypothetical protein [Candidatus Cloacimonadota bacterium]